MQVDIQKSDVPVRWSGDEITGATITDGRESLTLSVVKVTWMTFGVLRTSDNCRSWTHNSVAAINLLISHAKVCETVQELLKDLGPCDESRWPV